MGKLKVVKLVLACALLAAQAAAQASTQAPTSDPERIFAHAVQLHQQGDFQGAIIEYEAFLALSPNRPDAHSNLGAALAHLGRYEDAIAEYKRALSIQGRNPGIRFNLALALYKTAHFSEAAGELAQVIAGQPDNKNAILVVADCHLRMGEFKKVIDLLTPLDVGGNADRTVAYLLGTALINDNQVEKGQVYINRILGENDSAEGHVMMGAAHLMAREYKEAIAEFQHAFELNSKLPTVHSLYARAMLGFGDRVAAIAAFKTELEIDPNDFDSNVYIGMLLKQDEKYDDALAYLKRAALVRPGDVNVLYYLGSLYVSQGKAAEASPLLEQVVKAAPDFTEAHVSLATAYYRLKRKEEGDRERAIIQKLNAQKQAAAPGAKEELGPAYRGEPASVGPKPPSPPEKQTEKKP